MPDFALKVDFDFQIPCPPSSRLHFPFFVLFGKHLVDLRYLIHAVYEVILVFRAESLARLRLWDPQLEVLLRHGFLRRLFLEHL